jgi:hypothetical protein
MQFALSFQRVAQLNKLNCASSKANKDWPSGKAHEVMTQPMKKYKPEDTMAEIQMEKALSKLTLTRKKDPNNLLDKLSAIKCRYNIDMSKSKKKAQVFRVSGTHYARVISTTQMIWREKGRELTCDKLLKEMHIQWHRAGNKTQEEKDYDNEDEVVATATQEAGKKKAYSNPDKDKMCNHCKKKGHVETKTLEEASQIDS